MCQYTVYITTSVCQYTVYITTSVCQIARVLKWEPCQGYPPMGDTEPCTFPVAPSPFLQGGGGGGGGGKRVKRESNGRIHYIPDCTYMYHVHTCIMYIHVSCTHVCIVCNSK